MGGLALAEIADIADAITGVAPQAQGWGWAGTQAQAQRAGRLGSDSHTTGPQLCGSMASGRLPLGPSEGTVAPFHTLRFWKADPSHAHKHSFSQGIATHALGPGPSGVLALTELRAQQEDQKDEMGAFHDAWKRHDSVGPFGVPQV